MVDSFDRPADDEVRDSWMHACHSAGATMSGGVVTLSVWLTAFCWWRADGSRQKAYDDAELASLWHEDWRRLRLSEVGFPVIDQDDVSVGISRVTVTFYRDGEVEERGDGDGSPGGNHRHGDNGCRRHQGPSILELVAAGRAAQALHGGRTNPSSAGHQRDRSTSSILY
ncbi:hypothetical protein CTA1_6889 [Colletotrichum tanaceti]|uniref:Uncharacterized protein n=1 Tax=Colletotrichum tanaceti TaxID=1306861 RepID=A0A4U6XM85_9PEZI|nr:hypothetical protein CTA1_6889 [Colletotrichum tanaceti]